MERFPGVRMGVEGNTSVLSQDAMNNQNGVRMAPSSKVRLTLLLSTDDLGGCEERDGWGEGALAGGR